MAARQDSSQDCAIKDLKGGDPGMLKSTLGKTNVGTSTSQSPSNGG
jgi:hypothetical protein